MRQTSIIKINYSIRIMVLCFLCFLMLCGSGLAREEIKMTKSVIASGGGTSSGGQFMLQGTIGQWDAGLCSGGTFELSGGFWTNSSFEQFVKMAEQWLEMYSYDNTNLNRN